ncbi:MAG: glutamate 5-kinase [Spirochaetia bacterium]
MAGIRESITHARRIVIKVGTSVATGGDNAFSTSVMGSLVRQIASLSGETGAPGSRSFILVSSGAIALGLRQLHLDSRPRAITLLQAAAAMGQSRLMHAYEHEFAAARRETAQLLLTYEDIRNRSRYLNIRNTIFTLWSFGVVPIVNENDTVSFAEIRFGDNDIISAHLAAMLDADLLILLTDTDGVYDSNPREHPEARVLRTVARVTDAVLAGARGKGSDFSSGGMESKIRAADIATRGGAAVVIARGAGIDLEKVFRGDEIGTFFVPARRTMKGRKKWMAFNPQTEGAVVVDGGARKAILRQGRSLLPAGIKSIKGTFAMGSVIAIQDEEGRELARGLCNFSSEELEKIRGLNTRKIPEILGAEVAFDEVVHRDNLVIVAREEQ